MMPDWEFLSYIDKPKWLRKFVVVADAALNVFHVIVCCSRVRVFTKLVRLILPFTAAIISTTNAII